MRTSFEAALERNKIEVKFLRTNQAHLDTLLRTSMTKLDQEESILNREYISMVKKQRAKDERERKAAELAKARPISSKYFELINLKNVDKGNWLLPSLVKSLNEQRLNSFRTLTDIKTRERIQLVKKERPPPPTAATSFTGASTRPSTVRPKSTRGPIIAVAQQQQSILLPPAASAATVGTGFRRNSMSAKADLNATSFSNFSVDSFYLPNLNAGKRAKSAAAKVNDDDTEPSIYDINRFDLAEVKSIRRERLSARKMNESYLVKANLIKVMKQFDVSTASCSKSCKFKVF
jgi:hypothetical protein